MKEKLKESIIDFVHYLGTFKFWKELIIMTLGMSFGAAAVYYFLMPSKLIIGSISGLSIVLSEVFGNIGWSIKASTLILIINAILLVLAWLLIGAEFGIKTVYTALILGPLIDLWEKVLQRDMLLSILQRYISKEVKETVSLVNGKQVKKKTTRLIFPRYHQLDVVEKLIADTKATKEGKNYLIQHSAGSGKSNSIAWLTYRLAALHDLEDKEMFQTVFVVTDRRVLNRQLQETILGFEHLEGQIVTITDQDNSSVL